MKSVVGYINECYGIINRGKLMGLMEPDIEFNGAYFNAKQVKVGRDISGQWSNMLQLFMAIFGNAKLGG